MSVKTNQDLWQNYNLNVRQILWERLLYELQNTCKNMSISNTRRMVPQPISHWTTLRSLDMAWLAVTADSDYFPLCVWHLQTHGCVVDSTAVAAGNEFGLEIIVAKAVHLSCLRANKELLTLSSEGDGGHSLIQLHLSVQKEKEDDQGNRKFFIPYFMCNTAKLYIF